MRVSQQLADWMRERITRRNETTQEEPWDMSSYLRWLVVQDICHQQRAAAQRERRKAVRQKGGA